MGVDLVNLAKTAWDIVKDGKPSASAQSAYCQAMPSKQQLAWEELAGWKTATFDWEYHVPSTLDDWLSLDPSLDLEFHGEYQYGGESPSTPGKFLNNFTVWCKRCDVDWGWSCNVNATTQGNPFNAGSTAAPVGAIQLRVAVEYSTPIASRSVQWAFTCGGDGSYRAT